jgi:curved DNA-binding protein CbpA
MPDKRLFMPNDVSELYRILGVQPGVSTKEIKRAYRDLAKVWHPDRFTHDPHLQARAQEQLKLINEAYQKLRSSRSTAPRRPPSQSMDDSAGARHRRKTASSPAKAKGTHAPPDVPPARQAGSRIPTWLIAALLLAGNSNRTQRQRLEIWLFQRLL